MTKTSTVTEVVRYGNGVSTSFTAPFKGQTSAEIKVSRVLPDGGYDDLPSNQYSVTFSNSAEETTITTSMPTGPFADGEKFVIWRDTQATQLMTLLGQTSFNPQVIEQAFDKLTQLTQEQKERIARAVKVGVGESPENYLEQVLNARDSAFEEADRAEAAAAVAQATSGAGFPTRAAFVPAVAAGYLDGLEDGQCVVADGYTYRKSTGSTAIPDLPGWEPAGDVTPEHFGAVGDGITDDTSAFQNAIDALPAVGGQIVLSKPDYAVTGALVTGGRKILWKGGARINNSVYPSIPGIFESYDPANARRVVSRVGAGSAEFVQQDYYRVTGYAAAPDGVDTLLRAFTTIDAGSSTSGPNPRDEWPFQARVDNYSDNINGVANTGQARRYGQGAVWAGHFNCIDNIDPTTSPFAAWGIEVNIQGDGDDPQMLRRVGAFLAHSTSGNYDTPGANVIGKGILVQPGSADYNYGVHIMTGAGAGVSTGEFRDAALRIDAKAPDLIAAVNPVATGIMKVGSGLDTGVVSQVVGVGRNSASAPVAYTDIRTTITNNTAGAENGSLGLFVSSAGVLDQLINLSPVGGIQMKIGGSLKQVSQGAVDSGGAGFRVLRVPN